MCFGGGVVGRGGLRLRTIVLDEFSAVLVVWVGRQVDCLRSVGLLLRIAAALAKGAAWFGGVVRVGRSCSRVSRPSMALTARCPERDWGESLVRWEQEQLLEKRVLEAAVAPVTGSVQDRTTNLEHGLV